MSESPPKVEKPKRKWRKRLLWFCALLLLLALAINGPVARWGISHFLNSSLAEKGLSGETTVKGTLLSGVSLHDFSYSGDQGIQQISFTEASVSYRILRLLYKGKISNISLTSPVVVIDLEKFPPSESESAPLKETLGTLQKLISQQAFSITDADITLLKSTQPFAHFSFAAFDHASYSSQFSLQSFQAKDGANNETPKQDVTLTWNPSSVEIPHFEVLPDITLKSAHVDWTIELTANAAIKLIDAEFQVNLADQFSAKLTSGILDTKSLNTRFKLDLPFAASINKFDTTISNWKDTPQNWDISLNSTFPVFNFEDETLTETQVDFTQKDLSYNLDLSSEISTTPCEINVKGDWLNPEAQQWWASTKGSYNLSCEKLSTLPSQFLEIPDDLDTAQTSVSAKGEFSVIDLALKSITSEFDIEGLKLKGTQLPDLHANVDYLHLELATIDFTAKITDHFPIKLKANYLFEDDTYIADLAIKEDNPEWINTLLKTLEVDFVFKDAIDIEWNGTGTSDFTFDQKGTLSINKLTARTSTVEPIDLKAAVNYQWPESVEVTQLTIKEQNYTASCQLDWDQQNLTIHNGSLLEKEKEIANFQAQIPFNLDIKTPKEFFNQESPWSAAINSTPLSIPHLRKWFKLEDVESLNGLEGSTALSLQVTGSPRHPHINGVTKLENLRGISNQDLAALHMFGTFASLNDELYFSGELLEATQQRATLSLKLPFTPHKWFNSEKPLDDIIDAVELSGSLDINQLPLSRASRFVKQLKELKGHMTGSASLSGTIADPNLQLDTQIKIPKLIIAGFEVDDIRDIEINCKADQDRKISADLKASINGGEFTSKAAIDLTDLGNPGFEVQLKTNHAMVFRNDSISMRANADIKLAGTMEDATISGKIGFVESLFYKDIDILPIGVPSSAVADVELPALNSGKLTPDIPAPFDKWKLDVTLSMQDPLLIRGNLAGGQIEGKVKAGGTLGNPNLDGSIIARKVVAKLPFSVLKIKKGYAHFSPQNGIIPTLDIQGTSTIGNYDASLYVYGPATAPKTSFTSSPPLAQNDIMTLLATGVTSSALSNNKEVATLRALQLFLVKLRQESGDSRGTKVLAKILGGIEGFELNINDTDHFTGRKFSSAKANINKRLYFTAQIDGKKQTRGLIVYVIKSR